MHSRHARGSGEGPLLLVKVHSVMLFADDMVLVDKMRVGVNNTMECGERPKSLKVSH